MGLVQYLKMMGFLEKSLKIICAVEPIQGFVIIQIFLNFKIFSIALCPINEGKHWYKVVMHIIDTVRQNVS